MLKKYRNLKKKLIQNKEYFDHYEKNKNKMQKNINELGDEIYKLNNENGKNIKYLKRRI